jgi:hypothetical protein
MPMLCLAGTFHVAGSQPDGDSIHFQPSDPADWAKVPGPTAVRRNSTGSAQMRLDAIDALETHYTPTGGGTQHQPLELAHAAAAELLTWLGFSDVVRSGETVTGVAQDDQPGFILTRGADLYGRCVALLGRGDAPAASGTNVIVDVAMLRATANHHLITTGLAYPTFYTNLYVDLRNELAAQAGTARTARAGVFKDDETESGVTVESLATLTDEAVILPKLFRRLVEYLHLGDTSMAGFKDFLAQQADRLWIIPTGEKTGFDSVVAVAGQTVSLTQRPEDLVFEEK